MKDAAKFKMPDQYAHEISFWAQFCYQPHKGIAKKWTEQSMTGYCRHESMVNTNPYGNETALLECIVICHLYPMGSL